MDNDDLPSQVKELLASFPGVRVAWFEPTLPTTSGSYAGYARYGLEISNASTLSRIVHLACSVNVLVAVETDWNCRTSSQHDDPACIRYDLRVEPANVVVLAQVLRHALAHQGRPHD